MENYIDPANPMLAAFDKCLVEIISDPMPPPTNWTPYSEAMNIDDHVGEPLSAPNPVCAQRILAGFHKCEDELKRDVIGFIDVMKMMAESYDLE